ncbi:MAG: hypothetical protein GC208_08750 [Alphaproteobacteria bacterium]|nr:hypothetical protein [Alphaproteobacteria bacterium]
MTDKKASLNARLPLFSGRLEALRRNVGVRVVVISLMGAMTFALSALLTQWHSTHADNPANDFLFVAAAILAGLPLGVAAFVFSYGASAQNLERWMKSWMALYSALALFAAGALIYAVWVEFQIDRTVLSTNTVMVSTIPILSGLFFHLVSFTWACARGWRWRPQEHFDD